MKQSDFKITVVLKGWPRLSETFIAQELVSLERSGFELEVFSLRKPKSQAVHPIHQQLKAKITYLPEYIWQEPIRFLKAFGRQLFHKNFITVLKSWFLDLCRDFSASRCRRFAQALILADEMDPTTKMLYAHFLHSPSSVTKYAAGLTGKNWSFSAHAKDIWTVPEWDIKGKLESAQWGTTCTKYNYDYLKSLNPQFSIFHHYHGIDLSQFHKTFLNSAPTNQAIELLTVARAVDKKGIDVTLKALALLPPDLQWHWTHIGEGEALSSYKELALKLGIQKKVTFRGAQKQDEVVKAYQKADIFILSSRISKDGDRDGLPNVLMEAQAMGIPCVATSVSGITELIEHEENGLLCEPDDPQALKEMLMGLMNSEDLRKRLSQNALLKIKQKFQHEDLMQGLVQRFKGRVAL